VASHPPGREIRGPTGENRDQAEETIGQKEVEATSRPVPKRSIFAILPKKKKNSPYWNTPNFLHLRACPRRLVRTEKTKCPLNYWPSTWDGPKTRKRTENPWAGSGRLVLTARRGTVPKLKGEGPRKITTKVGIQVVWRSSAMGIPCFGAPEYPGPNPLHIWGGGWVEGQLGRKSRRSDERVRGLRRRTLKRDVRNYRKSSEVPCGEACRYTKDLNHCSRRTSQSAGGGGGTARLRKIKLGNLL